MKLKQLLPLALAFALLLTGCGGTGSGSPSPTPKNTQGPPPPEPAVPGWAAYSLAEPVYPAFPSFPMPAPDMDQNDYAQAERQYLDAITQLRADCDPALVRGSQALLDFAARSTPLALSGREGENAIYSPVSLWSALAMAARCADRDSRDQLLDTLGVGGLEAAQSLARQLLLCLYTDDGRDSLILSNSVWLNSAAEGDFVQATLDSLTENYFAGVLSVPMGTEEADRAVSEWVRDHTAGLIGADGPVVRTQPDTLALLASTLYYRAGWKSAFRQENTREDTFTAADGQQSQANFMHKTIGDGLFLLRDGYRAAYLPTRLGEMVFVLPDEGVSPESLLNDPEFLNSLEFYDPRWGAPADCQPGNDPTLAAHWGEIQWSVPKFDVDSSLDLTDTLKNLGVTDLLDPDKADLSALTGIPAYLSGALQMARVRVDEEEVEAAAVTILAEPGAAPPPEAPEICVMDLDRPFLFVIRSWDLPLFVGVVNQVG